jgi:hypothetical protein
VGLKGDYTSRVKEKMFEEEEEFLNLGLYENNPVKFWRCFKENLE